MYFALFYEFVDDYLERRGPLREEHLGLARAAADRGELKLVGAFAEPADSALWIWTVEDQSVIERFVEADPYVANGLVTGWRIRPWTVVVGQELLGG